MDKRGITSVIWLAIYVISNSPLIEPQCTLPDEVQAHWRINNDEGFVFSVNQQTKELLADSTVLESYTCESFISLNPDPGYYFLRRVSSDPSQKQCIQIFVDGNIMVYWENSDMPTDVGSLTASDCLDPPRTYVLPPSILIKVGAAPGCIFEDSLQGHYAVTVDYSEAITGQCEGDDASAAVIDGNDLQLNTCLTGDVRVSAATYSCMGQVQSAEFIGGNDFDAKIAVLARTVNGVTSYYCTRLLSVSGQLIMSIDFTVEADGFVICNKDQDHTSASNTDNNYVSLTLTPNDCDMGACENGGTCTQDLGSFECECAAGFTGETCETNIDDCDPDPCLNGGVCSDGIANFTCDCGGTGQFTGIMCEETDMCFSDPCMNNATCNRLGNDTYECTCPPGFTGADCETNIDECDPNPCENGGTCTDGVDEYTCDCGESGEFSGVDCEERDPCYAEDTCENGGTCTKVDDTEFTCSCPEGFTGTECETMLVCSSDPCENGATCEEVDPGDEYFCDCPPGYTGVDCEQMLYCDPTDPCENGGTCAEGIDAADCTCTDGFTGILCETELLCETSNTCENSATCEEPEAPETRVSCLCAPGTTGEDCETELYCEPDNPCSNGGTCQEDTDSCDCPEGWTGETCDTVLYCEPSSPCLNGGTCTEGTDIAVCECTSVFTGETCETALFCEPDNCAEGSTCDEESRMCLCPAGKKGLLCDEELLCAEDPCLNGGTCIEATDEAVCECPEGFSGSTCEVDMSACASSPCVNGTCSGDLTSYTCACFDGFSGTNCDEVDDDSFDYLPLIITLSILGAMILIGLTIWCCCCLFRGAGSTPVKTQPQFLPPPAVVAAPMIATVAAPPPPQPVMFVEQPMVVSGVPQSSGPIIQEIPTNSFDTPARIYDEKFGSIIFNS